MVSYNLIMNEKCNNGIFSDVIFHVFKTVTFIRLNLANLCCKSVSPIYATQDVKSVYLFYHFIIIDNIRYCYFSALKDIITLLFLTLEWSTFSLLPRLIHESLSVVSILKMILSFGHQQKEMLQH